YFYLYRSPTLRHLHSFPTRRSSDLATTIYAPVWSFTLCNIDNYHQTNLDCPAWTFTSASTGAATFLCAFIGNFSRPCWTVVSGRDRKSTRLNSSHDQISYAVFCLKK